MAHPTLTPTKLRAWLESLPPDAPCGTPRHPASCPLALYLNAAYAVQSALVSDRTYTLYGSRGIASDGIARPLPRWAQAFVKAVDALLSPDDEPLPISASLALSTLLFTLNL